MHFVVRLFMSLARPMGFKSQNISKIQLFLVHSIKFFFTYSDLRVFVPSVDMPSTIGHHDIACDVWRLDASAFMFLSSGTKSALEYPFSDITIQPSKTI